MKKFYLAYGNSLNLNEMKCKCKNSRQVGSTYLKDYRLVYKGGADDSAYLTIEENKGSYVPVGIYEISFFDELFLDQYEGYPDFYHKEYIDITIAGRKQNALVYVMNNEFEYHLPSQQYIDTCLQGYDDFNFDKRTLDEAFQYSKSERKIKKF